MPHRLALVFADLSSLGVPSWLWPAVITALVLVAVAFLVSIAANVVKCFEVFQAKPPAHQTYATKDELGALESRLMTAIANNQSSADHWRGEMTAKVDGLGRTFQGFTNDMMRAIGRIEGKTSTTQET